MAPQRPLITPTTTTTYTPFVYANTTVTSTSTLANYTYTSFSIVATSTTIDYQTTHIVQSATATVTTSCPATTTQSAACNPTNLVNQDSNGQGLDTFRNGDDTGSVTFPLTDDIPSCCQRCQEAEGCVAIAAEATPGNSFCELLFTGNATCGVGLYYGNTGRPIAPGNAFIVAGGCGTVEPL
ncbi:MAG: hypothetical protein Q9227_005406 [Pyrenula ochraceoflavens]